MKRKNKEKEAKNSGKCEFAQLIRERGWDPCISVKNIDGLSHASQARPFLSCFLHGLYFWHLADTLSMLRILRTAPWGSLLLLYSFSVEGSFGQGKPHRTLSSQEAEVKKGLDGGIRRTVCAAPGLLSILLSWGTGIPPQDILCASSRMLSLPQTS